MFRRRRRGKRAGVLVELRRGFRTAFPSIHSVRSLNSKIDELLLLNSRNLDLDGGGKRRGGGICFYINEDWCADVTVLNKSCSHDDHVSCFIHCGSSPYTHTHTHTHTYTDQTPEHFTYLFDFHSLTYCSLLFLFFLCLLPSCLRLCTLYIASHIPCMCSHTWPIKLILILSVRSISSLQ